MEESWKKIKKITKEKFEDFKDYKLDFQKLIFNFFMGYASILIVILILSLGGRSLDSLINDSTILYGILGCCSSLLAVSSIVIKDNSHTIEYPPLIYNILIILPIIGFMTNNPSNNNSKFNIDLLLALTIIGVIISFYYLTKSTNYERNLRKKKSEFQKDADNLRKQSEGVKSAVIGKKEIEF